MLIAVKSKPHERNFLEIKSEFVAIKVKSKDESKVICCLYIRPKISPYGWPEEVIESLIEEITTFSNNEICKSVILTGDMNFEFTNWKTLYSQSENEFKILECLSDLNFESVKQKENNQFSMCF